MKKMIHIFVYMFFTLALLTTTAYAWYTNYFGVSADEDKLSSNASYYASGSGTAKDPFIITEARHLYNLAWLQDLGYYDADKDSDTSTKNVIDRFYFELGDNIDMSELTRNGVQSPIPPIGIDQHPFISNFDGKGYTIDNLRIDTYFNNSNYIKPDDSVLDVHNKDTIDSTDVIITNYVGLFGYVGPTTVTTALTEKIQNFYVDNAVVTSTKNCLAGIIAGYVSSNVNDVGVHYGRVAMNGTNLTGLSNDVISYYTLIGDYNKSISWEDKPSSSESGGDGSGDSLAYGGNFDTDLFFQRMALIYANKTSDTPSPYFPEMESQYLPASGYKVPLTVVRSTITEANYTGATAKETISTQNIGYAIGNQNKQRDVTMEFGDPLIKPSDNNSNYVDANGETPSQSGKVPRQMFRIIGQNGNYQGGQIQALTDEEFAALPQNIQDLIPNSNVEIKKTFLRLQQRYAGNINVVYGSQNDAWSPMGQISYYGKTYGEEGALYNSGIVLPQNAIWFKPKNAGTVRIVMYSADNGKSFRITKVRRNSATTENPFAGSDLEDVTNSDSTIQNINNNGKNIPAYIIAYYEFEISQEEVNAGNIEYIITKGDENGAYFYYLDIGISGSEDGDTPTQDPVIVYGAIDDIDFVYRTGSTGTGSFIEAGTELSNVFFQISGTTNGLAEFYFRRNNDDNDGYTGTEGIVLYFPSENNSLTINWSKAGTKGKATDDDCETLDGSVSTGGLSGTGAGSSTTLKTVTFSYTDVNGTLQTAGIANVTSGYAINQPELTIPGYEINGYYSDEACSTPYTFGTTAITDNTTIYIKVTALLTYDVTFDPNNGSATTTMKVAAGGLLTKPTDPIKTGYIFDGWIDSNNNKFDFANDTINANTTLTATYVEARTVEFVDQNGNTIKTLYVADGSTLSASDIPTTTDDYYVTSVKDQSGNNITTSTIIDENVTIVVTKVNKYEVTFNSGDLDVNISSLVNDENGKVTLPEISQGTATVSSWQIGDQTYNPGDKITITTDMTLTAVWDYADSVIFDAGDGTFGSSSTMEVTLNNGVISALPTVPTRTDYIFVDWYLDSDYSTILDENAKITNERIYAKWRSTVAEVYTFNYTIGAETFTGEINVTLDENGNQVVTYPTSITYNGLTINNVTWYDSRTGYTGGVNDQYNQDELTYGNLIDSNYDFEVLPETLHPVSDGIKVLKVEYYNQKNEWVMNKSYFNVPSVSGSSAVIDLDIPETVTTTDQSGNTIEYVFYTLDTNYWGGGNDVEALTAGIVSGMSNVFVAAEYRSETFTVTFDTDGGSTIESQEVEKGLTVTKPTDPTKTGYIFAGWYSDEDLTIEYNFSTAITEDTTIYAKWEIETYTITYVSTQGSAPAAITGTALPETLPTITADGYNFAGWYKDSNFTTPAVPGETITADITLYAKWITGTTTSVTYDGNNYSAIIYGDKVSYADATFTSASSFIKEIKNKIVLIPVAQGSSGSLVLYASSNVNDRYEYLLNSDGTQSSSSVEMIKAGATLTFTANNIIERDGNYYVGIATADDYKVSSFTITYIVETLTLTIDRNDGTSTTTMDVAKGSTPSIDNPTRDGYEFAGWYTDSSCTSEWNGSVSNIMTIYAKWNKIYNSTVTFNSGQGTFNGSDEIINVNTQTGMIDNLESYTATREGYTFVGWYLDQTYTTKVLSSTVFDSNTTIYAGYSYVITLNPNGGMIDGSESNYSLTINPDGSYELPTMNYSGHKFSGWTNEEGTTITDISSVTAPTTLTAVWEEAIGIEVTFDADGGAFGDGSSSVVVSTKSDGTIVLPTEIPTKEGYVFVDWSITQSVPDWDSNYIVVDETTVVTSETTVYAVWKAGKTITFKYANNGIADLDGTEIGSITVRQGVETSQTITPPTIEGYEFVGWYWNQTINSWDSMVTTYTPWNDTVLYAKYDPVSTASLN